MITRIFINISIYVTPGSGATAWEVNGNVNAMMMMIAIYVERIHAIGRQHLVVGR